MPKDVAKSATTTPVEHESWWDKHEQHEQAKIDAGMHTPNEE